MITLFWCPQTRAARILWLLNEMNEEHEVRFIDIRKPDEIEDTDFHAASPMGKVPAIMDRHDDGTVYLADSAAITIYLADRYPASRLAPAVDSPDRGRYLYWTMYTPGVVEPAMMEKFNGWDVSRATSGWGNYDEMIRVLEKGVSESGGDWILGEQFSAADVMLGSSVYFMRSFGLLPESPLLSDYADRCLARPAYQAALARNDELNA